MSATDPQITVFYNGACPRCVRDRKHYEKWAGQAGAQVCWFDITGQEARLRALGIDPHRALTELHVLDEHRQIRSELDAYILLLDRIPRLKPLAWLIGRPWIRPGLARLYHRRVDHRLHRSGRLE
jgi:predicted DCC family thiol-disulfide oxidoreductase YuxK